ncbi:helix-turn-helix domain-containing protein [Candidatus Woesearchaeota archaeon]|nr:helix-turn-helix domain-containing protein [Candidatus Woesearchaeota archaeon]
MIRKEVLMALMDEKKAAVLKIILNSKEELYLKEISEKSNVSIASTFRILRELVSVGLLQKRIWKNSKVYTSCQNEKVEFLKSLFEEDFDGVDEFVRLVETVPGIQQIILHGSKKKGKANILIIGEGVNAVQVEDAKAKLKEKSFELSYLTLTKEQYEQMVQMGLYSGEKKVLKG